MKLEDFLLQSEQDQEAYIAAAELNSSTVIDLTAERDSLKTENEKLSGSVKALTEELKKVKETNYTLARHIDAADQMDPEEIINNMFK